MDDRYNPCGRFAGRTPGRNIGPVVPLPDPGEGGPAFPGGAEPMIPLPNPGEGGPVWPGGGPVAPLPNPGEGGPVWPGGGPVAPLPNPGEGGPVWPGIDAEPVIPLPDFGEGGPVYPGGNEPVIPIPGPGEGGPVYPGGVVILPGIIHPRYCTVRFLNAAAGYDPLRITVAPRLVCSQLAFGGLTSYFRVVDGFRTVTITSAYDPYTILYQQSIPFRSGELTTMAVVRGSNGLDLVRISDMPCNRMPRNRACIRAINLAYQAPPLDVFLSDGRLVFNDVSYKEATSFKQAMPRNYSFYIAQTPFIPLPSFQDIETIEDTPMVAPDLTLQGTGSVQPIVSFFVDAKAGAMYSLYILGTWMGAPSLRIRTVEDFFA